MIHGALEKAVELGNASPEPLQGRGVPKDDKGDMRVLTQEEQQRFIAALDGEY